MLSETYKLLIQKQNSTKEEKEENDKGNSNEKKSLENIKSFREKRGGIFFRKSTLHKKNQDVVSNTINKQVEPLSPFSLGMKRLSIRDFSNQHPRAQEK